MTKDPDYFHKIYKARNLDKIALYLRAQGCSCAAVWRSWEAAPAMTAYEMIARYENYARRIEACQNLKEARDLLKQFGF